MKSLAALRKNKKGFTLVEVIVVLVILAILAAILVPSLTGYIDKANQRAIVAETRACVMAAQTIASEKYATTTKTWAEDDTTAAKTLAEVTGTIDEVKLNEKNQVTDLTYTSGGHTCTYTKTDTGGKYEMKTATPPAGSSK